LQISNIVIFDNDITYDAHYVCKCMYKNKSHLLLAYLNKFK